MPNQKKRDVTVLVEEVFSRERKTAVEQSVHLKPRIAKTTKREHAKPPEQTAMVEHEPLIRRSGCVQLAGVETVACPRVFLTVETWRASGTVRPGVQIQMWANGAHAPCAT